MNCDFYHTRTENKAPITIQFHPKEIKLRLFLFYKPTKRIKNKIKINRRNIMLNTNPKPKKCLRVSKKKEVKH